MADEKHPSDDALTKLIASVIAYAINDCRWADPGPEQQEKLELQAGDFIDHDKGQKLCAALYDGVLAEYAAKWMEGKTR
jgi:hypothetical protein